jgi:hypothetical protein
MEWRHVEMVRFAFPLPDMPPTKCPYFLVLVTSIFVTTI